MKKIVFLSLAALLAPSFAFASVSIDLSGGPVTVSQGHSYNEPGYSAFSTVDGDITGSVNVSVPDTSLPGVFQVGYDVADSALDTATAFRTLTVVGGGGTMPFCSGPLAPGWHMGVDGGGCGGWGTLILPGQALGSYTCPIFVLMGCLIK